MKRFMAGLALVLSFSISLSLYRCDPVGHKKIENKLNSPAAAVAFSTLTSSTITSTCGVNIGGTNYWYHLTTTYDINFAQGTVAWLNSTMDSERANWNKKNFDVVIYVHRIPFHRRTYANLAWYQQEKDFEGSPQYGEKLIVDFYAWPGLNDNHPNGAAHCRQLIFP